VSCGGFDKFDDTVGIEKVIGSEKFNIFPSRLFYDIVPTADHAMIIIGTNNAEARVVVPG